MKICANSIVQEVSALSSEDAQFFEDNLKKFSDELDVLIEAQNEFSSTHSGLKALSMEPVAGYMLADLGIVDVTPSEFIEGLEEGSEVQPAVLQETKALLGSGDLSLLIANSQTNSPQVDDLVNSGRSQGIPVVTVSETLSADVTYVTWMTTNIDAIKAAVAP
jgi:zinc/manganese transport system substrate-binding protein